MTHYTFFSVELIINLFFVIRSVEDLIPGLLLYLVLSLNIELNHSNQVCLVNSTRLNVNKDTFGEER